MTNYDPFAYGSVRLDPNQLKGDGEPDPEDVLFGGSGPVNRAPAGDSSWSLLDEAEAGEVPIGVPPPLASFSFRADPPDDEDGEDAAAAPPERAQGKAPRRPRVETSGRPAEPVGEMSQAGPVVPGRPAVRRRPLASQQQPREPSVARIPPPKRPKLSGRRRHPVAAGLLPLILCAAGGTSASWFWVMANNPVMAGLIGLTTLVAALFTWLLLRG